MINSEIKDIDEEKSKEESKEYVDEQKEIITSEIIDVEHETTIPEITFSRTTQDKITTTESPKDYSSTPDYGTDSYMLLTTTDSNLQAEDHPEQAYMEKIKQLT